MTIEIAAILPTTPPAMAPECELGVAEFGKEFPETLLVQEGAGVLEIVGIGEFPLVGPVEGETEGPDGPSIVPGPNSDSPDEDVGVRLCGGRRQGKECAPLMAYDLLASQSFSPWNML